MKGSMNGWLVPTVLFLSSAGDGCHGGGGEPSAAPGVTLGSLAVTSASFASGGAIPVDFTCDGVDRSPQLTWSAPPSGTRSFAIIADDPDSPSGTFAHWVAFGVNADLRVLPEGADLFALGGAAATNDFHRTGYSGPCPPRGELHRYYFRVFALDAVIDVSTAATRDAVGAAMSGHVLAQGALVGVFSH